MHHQPIPGSRTRRSHPAQAGAARAGRLRPAGFWSLAELDRFLAPSQEARTGEQPSPARVEDAVADLYAAGLVHRIGQYVFATRAALAAEQLANC
jgi:hypothetical protein